MESKEKVELFQNAIKQLLIEEEKATSAKTTSKSSHDTTESLVAVDDVDDDDDHDENHHLPLLSKLLSQLDSLKEDGMPDELKEPAVTEELQPSDISKRAATENEVGGGSSEVIRSEEIIKELREVKKQNSTTHWLLSALIVLTLAWQLSEVSLILKLKEGLSNPLKSIGCMITGMFKAPAVNGQQVEKDVAKQKPIVQAYSLPAVVKVPNLPHALFSDEE